jgi:hypothetical protein
MGSLDVSWCNTATCVRRLTGGESKGSISSAFTLDSVG